jgi:hypothetical protein
MEISEAPSSIAGDHPPSTKKIEHRKTMSPRFPPGTEWMPTRLGETRWKMRALPMGMVRQAAPGKFKL